MHLTSIHISLAQTIIPFPPNLLLANVYRLVHSYAEVWLGFRNSVTVLSMFIIRLTIVAYFALSGKSGRTPTITFGLIVFSLIKLELNPAHVTITFCRPRSAEDISNACSLFFRSNCEKVCKGNGKLGKADLGCTVLCRCEGGCMSNDCSQQIPSRQYTTVMSKIRRT